MKKLLILALCCTVFVGCTSVNQQVGNYKEVSYDEKYYSNEDTQWQLIEKHIEEITKDDTENLNREEEINSFENYHSIIAFNVDSKRGREIVDLLKEVIGEELTAFIKDMKDIKEVPKTKEKVIGGYGVICTNDGQAVSIRCVKSDISLVDKDSKKMINEIISPEFIISEMHVGKDNNMIQIATPMFIRNRFKSGDDGKTASYYQIFRKSTGEVTKIRFVINKIGDEPLDDKHFMPLRNIIKANSAQDAGIEPILLDIQNIYDNKKIRETGKVNHINYKINTYDDEQYQSGKLIEVVLDLK